MSHFNFFSLDTIYCQFSNFSSLKILDLSGNSFIGSITPFIGALSSLKALSLYSNRLNQLNGILPIQGKNLL